jgi:hypothetical protein
MRTRHATKKTCGVTTANPPVMEMALHIAYRIDIVFDFVPASERQNARQYNIKHGTKALVAHCSFSSTVYVSAQSSSSN